MSALVRFIETVRGADPRELDHLPPVSRSLMRLAQLTVFAVRKMLADRAPLLAAALAYRSLFSLIPVLVLALMFLKAFSGEDGIRNALNAFLDYLAIDEIAVTTETEDGGEQPTEVTQFINEFIGNAENKLSAINYGAITAVGAAIFIYAALSLLIQIEHAFNAVCRAPTGRSFVIRLTNYWTMLTLGSLALFISFTLGTGYTERLEDLPGYLEWLRPILSVATTVGIAWLVLVFAYTRMPNTKVRLKPAAIGAAVAAILWELSKGGLTWFMGNAVAGQVSVYGSLALIPLLMFWVYVTWLIVLSGLGVATAIQSARLATGPLTADPLRTGPAIVDPALAVPVMAEIASRFARGRVTDTGRLASVTRLTERQLEPMLTRLVDRELVHRVDDKVDEDGFTLARPAEQIRVAEIIEAANALAPEPSAPDLARIMSDIHHARDTALGATTLADHVASMGERRDHDDEDDAP